MVGRLILKNVKSYEKNTELKKKILSKEGSSLVAVLMFLFIFITLSSSLLMVSIQNMNRSKKIGTLNSEYYDLDTAAEKALVELDNNFEEAEVKALTYIKDNKYKSDVIDTSDKQDFFYKTWKDTVNDPIANKTDIEQYNRCLDKFCTEAFGRLYYAYLDGIIDKCKIEPIEIDKDNKVDINISVTRNKHYGSLNRASKWEDFKPDKKDFEINIEVKNRATGKKLNVMVRPMVPVYNIVKREEEGERIIGNPIYTNAITAAGGITFKSNCEVEGDIYSSSAKGILNTAPKVNVYGNVYSKGDLCVASDAGEKSCIKIARYNETQTHTIKQSVFENKMCLDKKIASDTIIDKYAEGHSTLYKNTFFIFNDSKGGNVYCNNMTMGNSARIGSNISIAGNVSTMGSVINDSLYGGTDISMSGNYIGITPYIEDKYGSGTYIKNDNFGSYIENNIYDPPNKKAESDNYNSITLGSNFIVPGIKPLITDGTQYSLWYDPPVGAAGKLRSYESISCNFWDDIQRCSILNAYSPYILSATSLNSFISKAIRESSGRMIKTEEAMTSRLTIDFYNGVGVRDNFIEYMFGQQSRYNRDGNLINPLAPNKINVKQINTNIKYKSVEGYCATSAILSEEKKGKIFFGDKPKASHDYNLITNNAINKVAYKDLESKKILENIFEAKTAHFGTSDKDFESSIDTKVLDTLKKETGIRYYSAETKNILNVTENPSGIVYCEGNLLIKGSGAFSGTIICKGDVTVDGENVNIKYDEGVIKEKLKNGAIHTLFAPGEMGLKNVILPGTKLVENSVDRKSTKRYEIIKWKQGR